MPVIPIKKQAPTIYVPQEFMNASTVKVVPIKKNAFEKATARPH